ncbi:carboxypeptidase N subunit 2-like [Culicoides brevitarsis]|uniref:carboxypeptidase N subunit 2-like n=1 Tax=Culicoides brevitarsis TaxID=469753 RepID=UPI00307CBA88
MLLFALVVAFVSLTRAELVEDLPWRRQNTKCNETSCLIAKFDSSITPHLFVSECRADKVKIITFVDNANVAELPAELFNQVKYLAVVTLNESRAERVAANTLRNAKYLEELYLSSNLINILEADAFVGASQLKLLDLSKNQLETLEGNIFAPLKNLQELNLADNLLKSVDKSAFNGLERVTSIKLAGNALKVLDTNTFYPCKSLAYLYLQMNQLTKLRLRMHFNTMYWLNADDNLIEDLFLDADEVRNRAAHVYITANRNQIQKFKITEKYNVRNLYLEDNKFIDLQEITPMVALHDLRLGNNNLSHITPTIFKNLRNLEILFLQNTMLPAIQENFFQNQKNLKTLHIGFNKLVVVDLRYLKQLTKLEQLHLDANELTDLNVSELKEALPSLKRIELRDNPWNCLKLKTIMGYLRMYNVKLVSEETSDEPNVEKIRCVDEGREVDALKRKIKMLEDKLEKVIEMYNMNFCELKDSSCCSQAPNLSLFGDVGNETAIDMRFERNFTCSKK